MYFKFSLNHIFTHFRRHLLWVLALMAVCIIALTLPGSRAAQPSAPSAPSGRADNRTAAALNLLQRTRANVNLPSIRYGLPVGAVGVTRRLTAPTAAELQPSSARQIGVGRAVNLSSGSAGRVFDNRDGSQIRLFVVQSPGALELRVHFGAFDLPPGDEVYVYGLSSNSPVAGPYTGRGPLDNVGASKAGRGFWSDTMPGDTVIIEHYAPKAGGSFTVAEVSHHFKSFLAPAAPNLLNCHVDANCTNDILNDTVGRIAYVENGNGFFCSGTMLNDQAAGELAPYFLTARHCVSDNTVASTVQALWFFQSTACNSGVPAAGIISPTGATVLNQEQSSDQTLLRIFYAVPFNLIYSGWTAAVQSSGTAVYGLHHPEGTFLRRSTGSIINTNLNCSVTGLVGGLEVNWTAGATEPGTSGSGLFLNLSTPLVGVDSCGQVDGNQQPFCGAHALYGKFSDFFPDISTYLQFGDYGVAPPPTPLTSPNFSVFRNLSSGNPASRVRGVGWFGDSINFNGTAGQAVQLALNSTAFDTYLYLLAPSQRRIVAFDDDGGPGLNSLITVILPETGEYIAHATTFSSGATGAFQLSGCAYSLSPTSQAFSSSGGNGTISVTAGFGFGTTSCAWTAVSNHPSFVTILSGSSGSGNGTVTYSVAANPNTTPRTGTISVANHTFAVSQGAATVVVDETFTGVFPPPGWTVVNPGAAAAWTGSATLPCNRTPGLPFSGSFAIVDPSCMSIGPAADEQLITPPFNAAGPGQTLLEFSNHFLRIGNEIADVDVSTNNGVTWVNVLRMQGANDGPNTKSVNITAAIAPNPANVLVRYRYHNFIAAIPRAPNGDQFVYWAADNTRVKKCPTITVNPTTLPNGAVGTFYNQTFTATGTGAVVWNLSGAVPPGLTLNPTTGQLFGTPTAAGSFTFTATATDVNTCPGSRQYTVNITGNGLQFYSLPRPLRLLDTRPDQSLCDNVGLPITGGTSLTTQARITCNGITIPPTAQAIVGNVTVINQTASFGVLTLFPAGQTLPLAANIIYEPGQLLSNNFTVGLSANGEFSTFAERTLHTVIDVSGYFAPPGAGGLFYHGLPRPLRLLDTRADQSLCDNVGLPITGGTALTTQARISCNGLTIPTAAQAIVGNATVINQTASFGVMTLFPSGQTLPLAANMIYTPGQLLANAFTVGLSASGQFDTFAERTLHVVIDVAGYYSNQASDVNGAGLLFNPLPRPLRLLDTRADQSLCDNVGVPITGGTSLTTQARITCNGITIPTAAQAVNGNITVINQTASFGVMTLFPAGQTLPLAANLIYAPGQLLANAFVVGLSAGGQFNTFGERTIHVVIDVSGYFVP